MKKCKICGETKPLDQYHRARQNVKGVDSRCKTCKSVAEAERYRDDWFRYQINLKRSECRKKGLPFDLDKEYLQGIWTDGCPVFGVPFVRFDKTHDQSPALDRVDPTKGYVKGNVCYISARANRIKYNATVEELRKVLLYIEGATTIP